MMTAKDFKAIAKAISHNTYTGSHGGYYIMLEDITNDLCDYFQTTNAKFDRDKFLKACGVVTNVNAEGVEE